MNSDLWSRIDPEEVIIVQKFMSEYPVRLGQLARKLGIEVFRSPLPSKISGMIGPSKTKNSKFEIKVNKYESVERQRFTLAHEISHFLLHKTDINAGVVDSVMYRSALTSRKEAEANRLAADIVMPIDAVRLELHRLGGTADDNAVRKLAFMFNVSLPAMKVRLGLS